MIKLTKAEARSFLFKYQQLHNPRQIESDEAILRFIRKIGCLQYDPLNIIARNADLVLQSRCKNYTEQTLYRLLYEKRKLLDGWDKNMSIWSRLDWPFFVRKREDFQKAYKHRAYEFDSVKQNISAILKKESFLASKDAGTNTKVAWSWAPTDIGRAVLESLYHSGELVIHHKEGARKYYGLAEKLLPAALLKKQDPNKTTDAYREWYTKRRIGAVGLLWNRSGEAWLGSECNKEDRSQAIRRLLDKDKIAEVTVAGTDEIFYMQKRDLKTLADKENHREAAVLAPLDNLIWDRKLIMKLFDFDYKWEVYTPGQARKYGYYVLPIIYANRFIGRFEPVMDRKNKTLVICNWWWEKDVKANREMTAALTRCFKAFIKFLGTAKISISNTLQKDNLKWMRDL